MPTPNGSFRDHPAMKIAQITASASELDTRPRGLYISVSGSIVVANDDATTATINVCEGQVLPLQPYKVTTITTAEVYGLYY